MDFSTPEGGKALDNMRKKIVQIMIDERVVLTVTAQEKITVSPQEIADKIGAVKKNLNLSDADFDPFLQKHGMSLANFEKRVERDFLIERLIAKGTQEKGLTKDAWLSELNKRAKVEILAK